MVAKNQAVQASNPKIKTQTKSTKSSAELDAERLKLIELENKLAP